MPKIRLTYGLRSGIAPTPHDNDLLYQRDLTFLGSFKIPHGSNPPGASSNTSLNGGCKQIAVSNNRTLLVNGHDYFGYAMELSIRTPTIAGSLGGLPTAVNLQPGAGNAIQDAFGSHFEDFNYGNGAVFGGILPRADGKMIVTQYSYYDSSYQTLYTHMLSSQDLSSLPVPQTFSGILVPEATFQPGIGGFVGSCMCHIPTEWQAALGGTAISTGQGLSITVRTSEGPSATVFNAEDVGVVDPIPGRRLLGYPPGHRTMEGLGIWNNAGGEMGGCMIIPGTRTLLYFGTFGAGGLQYLVDGPLAGTYTDYGQGVNTGDINGGGVRPTPTAPWAGYLKSGSGASVDYYVYDPARLGKGYHQYPYLPRCWAYDLNDLVATKNDPVGHPYWETMPYAYWDVQQSVNGPNLPFEALGRSIYGATYDPSTRTIYLSRQSTDGGYPVIQAFSHPDFT